jgi:hypothetical protein
MKSKLNIRKVLLICFILFRVALNARETPFISHFSRDDYRGLNQNWSLGQSRDGFIYAANSAGLLVSDGQNWQKFVLPKGQIIRSLAVTVKNQLFTGSYGTFGLWEKDEFGHFSYTDLAENKLDSLDAKEEFWHILPYGDATYFQSFSIIYKWEKNKLVKIIPPGNIMFMQRVGDKIVIPVIGKGLFTLNRENNSFTWIPQSELLKNETVSFILEDKNGWLIGTQLAGVFKYDGRNFRPWNHELNRVLKQKQLNKALKLTDGGLVLGTVLDGIFLLDPNGTPTLHLNKENGLQNNTVLSLFEDRSRNLWVGLDKGIDCIHKASPISFFRDTKGILGTVYTAIMDRNLLYVGTNQGLFFKNKGDDSPFTLIEGTQGQVWQLLKLQNQLLCGHNNGTFLLENGKPKLISNITGGWAFSYVPERKNELLQATYTGLVLYKFEHNGWRFKKRLDGLNEPIKKLLPAGGAYFWALHANDGLYKLEISRDGESVVSKTKMGKKQGLPNQNRIDIRFFKDTLMVHTIGGNYYFDERYQIFKSWKPGTPENKDIWLDIPNAHFTYNHHHLKYWKDNQLKAIYAISMIPENENLLDLNPEEFFVGLEDGYALIPKRGDSRVFLSQQDDAPLLSEVKGYNKEGKSVPLHWVDKSDISGVELPPWCYRLSVSFGFPSFVNSPLFRFRLIGWQDTWSSWQEIKSLSWNNLSPGYYQLEVQANLSPKIITLPIFWKPHWYETFAFKLTVILLMIAISFFLLTIYLKKIEIRHHNQLRKKEIELEQQVIKAKNEQLIADNLNKSRELANATFTLIHKNESLTIVKEELDLMKSETTSKLFDSHYKKLIHILDNQLENEKDWQIFEANFNEVHEIFFKKLKLQFPDLTPGDLKLAAFLKMNLSSKEIAPLLNISIRGVENKRYRLRKKMDLDELENLTNYMIDY